MDRQKVIEALEYLISGECTDTQMDYVEEIEEAIALLKNGDVKTGHWEKPDPEGIVIFDENAYVQCSVCKKKSCYGRKDAYCRNCGAKMERMAEQE